MTKLRLMPILMTLVCAMPLAMTLSARAGANDTASEAAASFDRGDFGTAYKQYLKLAKDGDTFAQYRVSYMHAVGLGVDEDAVESLAWAVLAAEQGSSELRDYQAAVAAMVPGEHRKKAQKKADYYLRRWGDEDDSGGSHGQTNGADGRCTGSRLAAKCGQASSGSSVWISWGEDRSGDPAHRDLIEELNRSIVQSMEPLGLVEMDG